MDQFRKQQTAKQVPVAPSVAMPTPVAKKPNTIKYVIVAVIIIAVLAAAFFGHKFVYKNGTGELVGVNKNEYQALFLTNGQVYFGKLEAADKSTIKISDIYYLQVQQTVQPKEDDNQQGETQLVKLGEELHGPQDEMFIDRGQILFWENLKDGGKVVSAIKEYKKQ